MGTRTISMVGVEWMQRPRDGECEVPPPRMDSWKPTLVIAKMDAGSIFAGWFARSHAAGCSVTTTEALVSRGAAHRTQFDELERGGGEGVAAHAVLAVTIGGNVAEVCT
jgi:hypothetical protein